MQWIKKQNETTAIAPSHTFTIVISEVGKKYWIATYRDVAEPSTRKTISLHPNFQKSWHRLADAKRDLEELIMDVMKDESFRKETVRKYGAKNLKAAFAFRKMFSPYS